MLAADTIAAISTPPGEGAIAVLRISGPEALSVAGRLFEGRRAAHELSGRKLHRGAFADAEGRIDEGLLAVFRAPRSYTGEDMAEVHCHGGVLVAARMLEAVLRAGARAAEPGEFTRRAFLNGKMDLTQAEAVMDVIRAQTPRALRAAEEQLAGRLGRETETLREQLLQIVAHVEAWIDFPEEGIDPHTGQVLAADIRDAARRTDTLLSTATEGRILREGVRLVLCGAPNAGKSSLLNRLLGFERAIVHELPGTTRDTIEEPASLRGLPFRITDTAGLRETDDPVEREGVERAREAMARADIVLRVVDATAEPAPEPADGEIVALNKMDLLPAKIENRKSIIDNFLPISCRTGKGIAELVDAVVAQATGGRAAEAPSLAAINARHQACLIRAKEGLEAAAAALESGTPPEFLAAHLRGALDAVGEVTGAAGAEEILGRIFSTFCIGK